MVDSTDRPIVPLSHPDDILHRRLLAMRANSAMPKDGTEGMQQPLRLMSYLVADVPTASLWAGSIIYVSDEIGGATVAVSNGTNWVRTSDLATVS